MTEDSETILRVVHDESLARDWELVLLSLGLSPRMHHTVDGIVLTVPRDEVDRALAGLAAYEQENVAETQKPDTGMGAVDLRAGAVAGLLLIGFFALTTTWNSAQSWLERGSANAARILEGELWRSVTALTLHANVAHALSNAFATVVFFGAVSGQLGAGIAGALILLAGAAGNLINAYFQGTPHDAVGASTSVFSAVGMLGTLAMIRRRRVTRDPRRAWITIAASLALLGMLGSGGARVDVLAHLFGFLVGGSLGIVVALVLTRPANAIVQWTCGAAIITLLVYCWIMAFR